MLFNSETTKLQQQKFTFVMFYVSEIWYYTKKRQIAASATPPSVMHKDYLNHRG